VTNSPSVSGAPGSQCNTELSWMLVPRPIVMRSTSPRKTAPNQTLESSPSRTSPMTVADGAM